MSPNARRPRSGSSALRVVAAVVLLIALVGAWLPSGLAGAASDRGVSQADPEQSPPAEIVDGGEGSQPTAPPVVEEQVPPPPVVEQSQPPRSEPPVPEPVETIEPEPVQLDPLPTPPPTPSPTPEPTPEPWGPARVRLYDPLVAPVVPAGTDATYVLEVAHLGIGGPDPKELRADAPDGWAVRFVPNVAGESLTDGDGDGRPETGPLSVDDWTYVNVIVKTPAGLAETSSATVRVTASSFGLDQEAFRSWVDLSVTAVVPEPTPPPSIETEPSPSPDASAAEPTPEPGESASPDPSSDEQASASPDSSDGADPSASASADSSAGSSDSASPSVSASPSASASASPSAGAPTIVSVPADDRPTLVPGETTEIRHGFTVGGIAADEAVTLAVRVALDPAWLVTLETETATGERTVGDGAADLTIDVTGGQTVGLLARIAVPDGVAGGTPATLGISAEVLTIVDGGEDDSLVEVDDMAAGDALAADPPSAETTFDLEVESVASNATLSVEGGAVFGQVNVMGAIDPSTSGVTSTVDDGGATYTQAGAVTLEVSGVVGVWSVSCGTNSEDGSSYEWREAGGPWQSFPAGDGPCLTGTGPATVVIDIRLRLDWGGEPGSVSTDVTFSLQDERVEVARPPSA